MMFIVPLCHADTYDLVTCVGLFCPGHVKVDCLTDFIRVVKPGNTVECRYNAVQYSKILHK